MIFFARRDNPVFQERMRAFQNAGGLFERLDPEEAAAWHPALSPPEDALCCFTPEAAFLDADLCVRTHVDQAGRASATVMEGIRVKAIDMGVARPVVYTSAGHHVCERLIITAGSWTSKLLSDLNIPLQVTRQQPGCKRIFRGTNVGSS